MGLFRGHFVCDSCSSHCDLDPMDIIDSNPTYGVTSPSRLKELQYFWLCGMCKPDFPNGAKDFYIPEFFTDFMCSSCDDNEVEEDGYLCDYCLADEASEEVEV